MRDVAVVGVVPSLREINEGDSVDITVVVRNEGTESETFNVTTHHDRNIIETQTDIFLEPGTNTTLTFTWNTIGVPAANYTISAEAGIVLIETDTDDNTFTNGKIRVVDKSAPKIESLSRSPAEPSCGGFWISKK